ncbi:MAG: family 20 glycosylhydrolase [Clostridia bacterium]|nr:family 20 glycosylhydrolase [Clostridia bacterium]
MSIKDIIFKRLKFSENIDIEYIDCNSVYVKYSNKKAIISNHTKSFLTRGLALLVKGIREGKTEFEITEKACFETRGAQLELSRNGVMRVDSIKKMLEYMACMGLNSLILYMEDVYKMEKYPFFGYMRGAYSKEELCEIDNYAEMLGIDVIPGIQVLGHMEQYLRWPEAGGVRSTEKIMLCGEEKTYELIEEMIKTMRSCFKTKRIHIGCDEAFEVALGEYVKRNGLRSSYDIISEHVNKVTKICDKYGFRAMMYSDLFFKFWADEKPYYVHYDSSAKFPENIAETIPDTDMVFWTYGHYDDRAYDAMLKKHCELGRKTVYLGAIWGWGDLLPRYTYSFISLIPGLKGCIRNGITEVFASTWGDDGTECNKMFEMFAFTIVSEICFKGESCTKEEILEMSRFLFGVKPEFFDTVSESGMPTALSQEEPREICDTFYGAGLFWTDVLYNLTCETEFYKEAKERYKKSAEIIKGCFGNEEWSDFEKWAVSVYEILEKKAEIIVNIRNAYNNNNREYLKKLGSELLPSLTEKYRNLHILWKKMWLSDYKPFGWEVIDGRMGFVNARLNYATECINDYLAGKLYQIEELEEEFIENGAMSQHRCFKNMASTSYII